MSIQPHEILTLPEAAAYLRVSEDVLQRMAAEGAVPVRKVGTEWRFLKSGLDDWLRGDVVAPVWVNPPRAVCPGLIDFPRLVDELERRILAKLSPPKSLPEKGSKERILQLVGKWKDDPTLDGMLRDIHKQRGRPMAEEDE